MNNVMDIDNVERVVDSINIYRNQESVLMDDIISLLNDMSYDYATGNSKGLRNLNDNISYNFNVVNKIHDDNISVINSNKSKYIRLNENVKKSFDEIER